MKKQFALVLLLTTVPPAIAFGTNLWIVQRMSDGIAAGLPDGRIEPCPPGVDCVSTEDADAPLAPIAFQGDPDEALDQMGDMLRLEARAQFVIGSGDALVATFARDYVKVVEDVELLLDRDARVFRVRAIARTKTPTQTVRSRVEELRVLWSARQALRADAAQPSPGR